MGKRDVDILQNIKEELQTSDQGRHMKIFNRTIEPNEHSCDLYKAAIESLPNTLNDDPTEFEICQQTFQEYKERQQRKEVSVKFDMVHFIHSIYYVDIEQTLIYCFEKELREKGVFVCIVEELDFTTMIMQIQWYRKDSESKKNATTEKMIKIAQDNGWKHEIYTQKYLIDVTDVFDEKSTEGNLLLDFFTHTVNFRETADQQKVEETLALIKDNTIVKDGKLVGEKDESLILIYK